VDDDIERAVRIGEANAKVIELARNWCAHLEVEKNGGTGIVEAQTGLPIGMRSFKCVHASAAGFAGMVLETIALDFYDRNCIGCKKRVPVQLPNLSQLVAEREREASAVRYRREAKEREEETLYEARRRQREILSEDADEATRALFESIDSFDADPTSQKAEVLVQLSRIAPERFDKGVQEALFRLGNESTSYIVLDAVLTVLRNIQADRKTLCDSALRVLSRSTMAIAGTIIAENVSSEHVQHLAAAIPALIALAGPHEHWFPPSEVKDDPEGLLAVFRVAAGAVSEIIGEMLGSADKVIRIRAVHAIQLIRQIDDSFGLALIEPLVLSTVLPDNAYDIGSSEGWVQDLLAELLESHFDEVDPLLTSSFANLQEHDADVGLDQVYLRLFRSHRHGKEKPTKTTHAHEVLFARVLNYLSTKCAEQGSLQLLEFLRHDAEQYPDLVEAHIDGLLGAIAILADEQVTASSSLLQLHLPPNPLVALEAGHRKQCLHYLVDAVAHLVGNTAKQRPGTVGNALLSTITQIEAAHDELRAALVTALGLMAQNRETLPSILPSLYGAMTCNSQRVRAAAARAYGELINRDPDDLPPLLHATFIALLSDPYVIVHWAALDVLDRSWLPDEYDKVLQLRVFHIIGAHSGSKRDDNVLKVALDVFLGFHRGKNDGLSANLRDFMLDKIKLCGRHDRAELLRHHAFQLMEATGFTRAVLELLTAQDVSEYTVEDLIGTLRKVPPAHIRAVADEFVSAIETCSLHGHHVVDAAIEILTGASLWSHAMKLCESQEKRWGDSEWDRQRKLHSHLRLLGCAIEYYSSEGDLLKLRDSVSAFRQKEEELCQDEEKHRKRRDPLFGIGDQSQSS
jgi:hypothetical protein